MLATTFEEFLAVYLSGKFAAHGRVKAPGRKDTKDQTTQYLHRGIGTRAFKKTFNLAERVKVVEASQENGLLVISLKREIPEALKPRRIQITAGPAQPETQDNARSKPDQIGRPAA